MLVVKLLLLLHNIGGKIKEKKFQLSFRSRYDLFPTIKKEILNIHSYEVPEISCTEILDDNQEFFDWIDKEVKN